MAYESTETEARARNNFQIYEIVSKFDNAIGA